MIWNNPSTRVTMWSRFSKQIFQYTCTKVYRPQFSCLHMHNSKLESCRVIVCKTMLTVNRNKYMISEHHRPIGFHLQARSFHYLIDLTDDCALLKGKVINELKIFKRYRKGKRQKREELEESSEDESSSDTDDSDSSGEESDSELSEEELTDDEPPPDFPEDAQIDSDYKEKQEHFNSPRCDTIIRKAFNMKSNEVLDSFYAGNIFVNDKKAAKKNYNLKEGDYADVVVQNLKDKILMKRVRILKISDKNEKGRQAILLRVWNNPYEKESDWSNEKT